MDTLQDLRAVKWGYCTHLLRPAIDNDELSFAPISEAVGGPRPNDVVIAEVVLLEHHKKIELHSARSATLYEGDRVGVAYGHRYATRQFEGIVPDDFDICHLLSVGGVCGRVVGKAPTMGEPTILRPIALLCDSSGARVNLRDYGRSPVLASRVTTIVVVGSSMDSGKTTAAAGLVRGLTRCGSRVCAGKITGTGSAKDLLC